MNLTKSNILFQIKWGMSSNNGASVKDVKVLWGYNNLVIICD